MDVGSSLSTASLPRPRRVRLLRAIERHGLWFAPILAMLLTLPSLGVGWIMDDHWHRQTILGSPRLEGIIESRWDLFRFFDGDPERTHRMMEMGLIPWWTSPELRGAFWRPVTVLTHWIDYQLWPNWPVLMHAHSVLWFGLLAAVVGLLYRRLVGGFWPAGLAALLYAVDDARGMPVGFLANRNAIVAAVFGVTAILLHDRWRRANWRWGAIAAPAAFALSLLSSEGGLATTAYLFAYACFLEDGPIRKRFGALIPYAILAVVWRTAWTLQGYGVSKGMGLYVDPLTEPVAYLGAALERIPLLLLGQWALPPADLAIALGPSIRAFWALAAFVIVLAMGWTLFVVLRQPLGHRANGEPADFVNSIQDGRAIHAANGNEKMDRRLTLFWTVGTLLSLPPICATFASDRLLFFVGLGAMALMARFLVAVLGPSRIRPASRFSRVMVVTLAVAFIIIHLGVAPVALAVRSATPAGPPSLLNSLMVNTPMDDSVEQQSVVVVNAPSVIHVCYLPAIRELAGQPVPRLVRTLSPAIPAVTVQRVDARTLVIRPERGYLLWFFDRLFRSERDPFVLGDHVVLEDMTVTVTELTSDGRPWAARFEFAVPLDDPSLRWLHWDDGEFQSWTPPPIGTRVELRPDAPVWLFAPGGTAPE